MPPIPKSYYKLLSCSKCKENKRLEEFRIRSGRSKNGKREGRCSHCRLCEKDEAKKPHRRVLANQATAKFRNKLREKNISELRKRERKGNLKRLYGLELEEYETMLCEHKGVCAICGEPPIKGRGKKLHVDHDHETGIIRGLLCGQCNSALGNFKDSVKILKKAIEYLTKQKHS